jgi:hypothetical protein
MSGNTSRGEYVSPDRGDASFPARPGTLPFEPQQDPLQKTLQRMEEKTVQAICRTFHIPLAAVRDASFAATGKPGRLTFRAMGDAVTYNFPAEIVLTKPRKGKGKVFTLNRLLTRPTDFLLFSAFFAELGNPDRLARPLLLTGVHQRVELIAVTNLPVEPDFQCFAFSERGRVSEKQQKTGQLPSHLEARLVFGTLSNVLAAMKNQDLWRPF